MARYSIDKANPLRGTPNQQLCKRCQPFDDLVSISAGNNPLRLGCPIAGSVDSSLRAISNTHCLVCQALSAAVGARLAHEKRTSNPQLNTDDVLVRNYGPYFLHSGHHDSASGDGGSGAWMVDWSDPSCSRLRLIVRLDIICSAGEVLVPFYMTPQLCLRHSRTKPTALVGVEPWEVPYFDTTLLRRWIDTCDGIHGHRQNAGAGSLPAGFRVIDVDSMKVTKPADSRGFVALSYMWADAGRADLDNQLTKASQANLESHGGLSGLCLPAVISDAIVLCRALGERYLWVDRLSIVQDDTQSKHGQIGAMDLIYSSASFTIVAALNPRDGFPGLPGCPGRPRVPSTLMPPRICEGQGRGIKPVALTQVVDECEWNRRGWTFQERLLSKRRLFITEHQVIFQCASGTAYEELSYLPHTGDVPVLGDVQGYYPEEKRTAEMKLRMEQRHQHRQHMPGFEDLFSYDGRAMKDGLSIDRYDSAGPADLESYFECVRDYTDRQLTFPSDIMNAFAGVANALSRDMHTRMLFGMPEKYLVQSLLWSRTQAASPRSRAEAAAGAALYVPSWSWASAAQPVDYLWSDDRQPLFDLTNLVTLVYLHVHDPDAGLRAVDQRERWRAHEGLTIRDAARMDVVPASVGSQRSQHELRRREPDEHRSAAVLWAACPHNARSAVANQTLDAGAYAAAAGFPGALVFNTTVADLWVQPLGEKGRRGTHGIVASLTGQVVGKLSGAGAEWIAARTRGGGEETFRFVVLSGGLSGYQSVSKSLRRGREGIWRLYVMLVEPVPGQSLVVRRVEVGYVYVELWSVCQPRWETVVLC